MLLDLPFGMAVCSHHGDTSRAIQTADKHTSSALPGLLDKERRAWQGDPTAESAWPVSPQKAAWSLDKFVATDLLSNVIF